MNTDTDFKTQGRTLGRKRRVIGGRCVVAAGACLAALVALLGMSAAPASATPINTGWGVVYADLTCPSSAAGSSVRLDMPVVDFQYARVTQDGIRDWAKFDWWVNKGAGWYYDGSTHAFYNDDYYVGNPLSNYWHDGVTGAYINKSIIRPYPAGTRVAARLWFASGADMARTYDWTWWTWAHTNGSLGSYWWDWNCMMPAYTTTNVGGSCPSGMYGCPASAIPAARIFSREG
ncbi:hypothetical protein [Phycicoccus sp. Soil802]|uniref:hypothetical protein n=1 Tax=Phycicoccus sp. Soil802 TaxID=1736414 RepID=UPI000703437D|nr:hypothetical protein [Phycicoccus sp. Soil802]KRF27679.1 hypothetical protein ASG91_09120 [Phycicoccus sp. Soil802]